jgi:hypothetical protein
MPTVKSVSERDGFHRPDGHRGSRRGVATALGDLTWPEAEELAADGAVLAVPVGATEQHGPHLPMATDTDVAMALAARLAARRRDVIVAPPVGYGSSGPRRHRVDAWSPSGPGARRGARLGARR